MRMAFFKRGKDFYVVDLMLKALSGRRLASQRVLSPGGNLYTDKVPYGVHFRFGYPADVIESGNYDAVVHEINQYLLPTGEYKGAVAAAQQAKEGPKKIDIQPGMSKDDVVKNLGEPDKTITFGPKTILKYKDVTVELEADKVTEVKAN